MEIKIFVAYNFSFYVSVTTQAVSTPAVTTSNDFDYFFTTQPVPPSINTPKPGDTTPKQEVTTPEPDVTTPQQVITTKPVLDDHDDNALIDDDGIICPTYTRNSGTNTAWNHADWVNPFQE